MATTSTPGVTLVDCLPGSRILPLDSSAVVTSLTKINDNIINGNSIATVNQRSNTDILDKFSSIGWSNFLGLIVQSLDTISGTLASTQTSLIALSGQISSLSTQLSSLPRSLGQLHYSRSSLPDYVAAPNPVVWLPLVENLTYYLYVRDFSPATLLISIFLGFNPPLFDCQVYSYVDVLNAFGAQQYTFVFSASPSVSSNGYFVSNFSGFKFDESSFSYSVDRVFSKAQSS
nr:hypothetical protein [Hepeviridae sp.]